MRQRLRSNGSIGSDPAANFPLRVFQEDRACSDPKGVEGASARSAQQPDSPFQRDEIRIVAEESIEPGAQQ